jgi:hypothetical protein
LAVLSCSQAEPTLEHFAGSEVACPVVSGGAPAEAFK